MAAIGGQIKGTADTLNAMRMLTARQAQQAAPQRIDLVELWNAVVAACKHEEDKPVGRYLQRCGMQLWSLSSRSIALPPNNAAAYMRQEPLLHNGIQDCGGPSTFSPHTLQNQ
jgi:hypothetical protein